MSSATYLLEVSARVSLRVVTDSVYRGKNPEKFAFLTLLCKAKTEECNQRKFCFSENFRTFVPCSNTYFLEVIAHISLNVTANGFLRDKKLQKLAFLMLLFHTLFSHIFSGSGCTRFNQSSHQWSFQK